MGACFQAPHAATWTVTDGKHFIFNISFSSGRWCNPLCTSILLLHVSIGCFLGHNCTYQNNLRLVINTKFLVWKNQFLIFSFWHSACIFIHHCAHGGVGNFSFSPYTPASCTCHLISLIILLIIIHHNFHPIVTCSFICTELSVLSSSGSGFIEH